MNYKTRQTDVIHATNMATSDVSSMKPPPLPTMRFIDCFLFFVLFLRGGGCVNMTLRSAWRTQKKQTCFVESDALSPC